MDYEKLHKDTIKKLHQMVNSGKITVKTACSICADFVSESEYERIRKELLDYCKNRAEKYPNDPKYSNIGNWIAWLEKQCEQKPWSEEDKKISSAIIKKLIGSSDALCVDLQSAIGWVKNIKDRVQPKQELNEDDTLKIDFVSKLLTGLDQEKYDSQCMKELSSWLKSLKDRVQPKQEWSEEDNRILSTLTKYLEEHGGGIDGWECSFLSKWLKSLRPQNTWKPSEEQMKALRKASKNEYLTAGQYDILVSLYDDLKKLSEG